MRRTARLHRLLFALLATVQVAAPAGAALADAVVHAPFAEQHDRPGQTPRHDTCIFCQLLGQHAATPHACEQPQPRDRLVYEAPSAPAIPVRETVPHLPDSRAPPLA